MFWKKFFMFSSARRKVAFGIEYIYWEYMIIFDMVCFVFAIRYSSSLSSSFDTLNVN